MKFGDQVIPVSKIRATDFTAKHHDLLSNLRYEDQTIVCADSSWRFLYLGTGEEKAVYCACDGDRHVFCLELIDERTYLNGRFVGGEYFFKIRCSTLSGVKANPGSALGLVFSGLVKVREFVYGYEWSRFQFDPAQKTPIDYLLTRYLQACLREQFRHYANHYRDVHERNVLFEIRSLKQSGVPCFTKTWNGTIRLSRIRLQPIDVR
jgi:hypothetical protein